MLFLPENAEEFPFEEYDYIVDAVDTVTAKIELVMKAQEKGCPSSAAWEPAINLTRDSLRWQTFTKRKCVRWQK